MVNVGLKADYNGRNSASLAGPGTAIFRSAAARDLANPLLPSQPSEADVVTERSMPRSQPGQPGS